MKLKKTNTLRSARCSICPPEIENVFNLISDDKIEELKNYILDENNKVWNVKKIEGITLLHNACILDKINVIETIVNQTKNRLHLSSKDDSLSQEEKSENEKIFKDFINAKTEGDNLTALHYASFRGNIKAIKLLIENFAEINALSSHGLNMIHKAAQGNKPSAIIYFNKKYNMDLKDLEENHMNALHLATISGMDDSVIFLLSLGLDPNIRDKFGYTALHYAVKYNQNRIIKKLLQKGADKEIKENKTKKTPVMMAKNKPEILEIFRKKGVCEKLFFKPDISQKTFCSNKNMILFVTLHLLIIFLVFFILIPYFNNTYFSISYLAISGLVFGLYIILSFSNPGKMINWQYRDLLDIVEKGEEAENFCPYCLVKKKFRSLHCLVCQKCVDEFDHHCFWVGNCIGKKNYTLFFIFLVYILLNTLFNIGLNIYYLANEMIEEYGEPNNDAFPGFYFGGPGSRFYHRITRIVVSACCFVICFSFFIPLFNLFRMQLSSAIEKRQIRKDEKEYEKTELKGRLDEEVWEDLEYEEENDDEVEINIKSEPKEMDEKISLIDTSHDNSNE